MCSWVRKFTNGLDIFPGVGNPNQLLDSGEPGSQDRLLLLQKKIADLLGTSSDNVNIISVRNATNAPGSVDITYAAHGSPYYTPEKLDTLVWMNRQDVSRGSSYCKLVREALFI